MRAKELHVEDVGGFADARITFEEDVTVLVGQNGSGKSKLLEALNCVVTQSVAFATKSKRFEYFDEREIRVDAAEAKATLLTDVGRASVRARRSDDLTGATIAGSERFQVVEGELGDHLADCGAADLGPVYSCLKTDRRLRSAQAASPALPPEAVRLGQSGHDGLFHDLLAWFRREENAENEVRLSRDPSFRKPALQAVRVGLQRSLDVLGDGLFTNPRFSRVGGDGGELSPATDGTFVFDKAGQQLQVEQLSDGEQVLLLTVCDVARRLAIANPTAADPLSGNGVVVIDEIELHLHPGWQRTVIPALRAAFPNVQLIVSTHSPQVLGSVDHRCVRILEDFEVHHLPTPTLGRDSNAILREVLGVSDRSREMEERLTTLARYIDAEDLEAAGMLLADLAEQLTDDDPDVVRYRALLHFLT